MCQLHLIEARKRACQGRGIEAVVLLIFTKKGFEEMLPCIATQKPSVWVAANVLSAEELDRFRAQDINLTNFTYSIDPSIADALDTVYEHHPGETVWVESVQFVGK